MESQHMGWGLKSIVRSVTRTVSSAVGSVANAAKKVANKTISTVDSTVSAIKSGNIKDITKATLGIPFKVVGSNNIVADTFDKALEQSFKVAEKAYNATLTPAMKAHNALLLKPAAKLIDKSLSPLIDTKLESKLNKLSNIPNLVASGKLTLGDFNDATFKAVTDSINEVVDLHVKMLKHPSAVAKGVVGVGTQAIGIIPIIGEPIADTVTDTTDMVIMGMGNALPNIGNSLYKMVQGDFSSENLKSFGKGYLQAISSFFAITTVSTEKVIKELLRNDTMNDLNTYSGGILTSGGRLVHAPQQVAADEKLNVTMLIFDAINVGMSIYTGGIGMSIMMATNAIIDQTGLDRTTAGLIARSAVLAATSNTLSNSVKIAVMGETKKRAIEKGTKTIIEKTPINDSAIVASTLKIAAAKATGEKVQAEAINQAINHTAKNVPVKKDLIRSIVNVGMGKEKSDVLINEIKKHATKLGKEKANEKLAKTFGPEVTVDRIIKYGNKFQLKYAENVLNEIKRIPYNVAKMEMTVDIVNPNGNFITRIGKEVGRSPENMALLATKAGKEVGRSPQNLASLGVKAGKEIMRAPDNVSLNVQSAYNNIADKAQKEWNRFITDGYKKWGKKLFEFLMAKYGQQDNYDSYIQEYDYIYYLDWEMPEDAYQRTKFFPKSAMLMFGTLAVAGIIGYKTIN